MKSIPQFKFLKTTLLWTFILGVMLASCSKKDDPAPAPADKASLQTAITAAVALNATVEGTKPGQYETGSKAALVAALTASNAVLADAGATQASVNNATAQLLAAIAAYQGHLITEIAAASLIGYWKMNGNANDSSGNANNGVVTIGHAYFGAGTPTLTADRFGRASMAYHFDKGGNIDVPYKASLNPQQMSVSVWVKWSSTGRTINADTYTMLAMNRWNGFKFQLQNTHLPFYTVKVSKGTAVGDTTIYDRDTGDGFSIAEDTWRHLVVTFTSATMSFYIDGDLVKTWDAVSSRPVPGNALTLANPVDLIIGQDLPTNKYITVDDGTGNFFVNYGGFFTGDLDDMMFYNVALTGPQVHSIFVNQNTL
jgi:hypothetical protein